MVKEYKNVVKREGGAYNYTVVTRSASKEITFSKGNPKIDDIMTTDRHTFPDNADEGRILVYICRTKIENIIWCVNQKHIIFFSNILKVV